MRCLTFSNLIYNVEFDYLFYPFMDIKNSSFEVRVFDFFTFTNSIASIGFMSARYFLNTQTRL